MSRNGWAPLLGVFVLALALRLVHLWEMWHGPFSPAVYLPIDAGQYQRWALAWLEGEWPPAEPYFRAPLYTLFLGSVYAVLGPSPLGALVLQCVLGAAGCVLVHGIALELFADRRVAILAALASALTATLIYFDAQLLSGSLDVFLQLAALRLLLLAARREASAWWLAAGGFLGLSALHRGAILLYVPFVLLWLALLARGRAREAPSQRAALRFGATRALALLVPLAAALLPVSWHNARYDRVGQPADGREVMRRLAAGEFVTVAANSGINFYLGNQRVLRQLNRLDDPEHLAVYNRIRLEPGRKGIASASGANAYLVRETLRQVAAWPGEWLQLMGTKLAELLNGTEIPRNTSPYADRQDSWVLRLLLWRFLVAVPSGLILPLGLLGLFLARRSWREHMPVWGALLAQAAFVLAFFVTARYRLPMLPLLTIYAAYTAVVGFDRWRARDRDAGALLGSFFVLVALCNLPIVAVSSKHHWVDHYNLGVAHRDAGEPALAEPHLRKAAELNPQGAIPLVAWCEHLAGLERWEEALPACSRAVTVALDSASARYHLGLSLESLGRLDESLEQYQGADRLQPGAAEIRRALGRVRQRMGPPSR